MIVKALYFGALRAALGRGEEELDLPAGSQVCEALARVLSGLGPDWAVALRCAVNEDFAPLDRVLLPGDEVAFLPPVAGGSPGAGMPSTTSPATMPTPIPHRGITMKRILLSAALALGLAVTGSAGTVETTKAKLGYIALTDFSPLAIALEKGLFAKHGMTDVQVIKQASWGSTRDNLELGSERGGIDGAHILTPMPYAISLGLVTKGKVKVPMYILARLNLNGQGISAHNRFKAEKVGLDASPIKPMAAAAMAERKALVGAMTFPTGTHNYWLRYWLASAGIDPDTDVATLVVPPPQMVANMRVGTMDFFCVGEPWNQQLVNQKLGYSATVTQDIWKDHPEKALGMRKDWVDKHPKAAKAILKAVMEAQMWCDKDENKKELAEIVAKKQWINCAVKDVLPRLEGTLDYGDGRVVTDKAYRMTFWARNASFPYKSHDKWFLAESRRWGFFPNGLDYDKVIAGVNSSDLWREAARELGVPEAEIPKGDSRGKETFFDGVVFDPADPEGYLAKLEIKNLDGKKTSLMVR
jgi:nitrate/nitrite transport system substrate-binding protein